VRRSASLCAEQQQLLEQVSAEKLEAVRASSNTLDIEALKKLSAQWLHQVLRYWLTELGISSPAHSVLTRLKDELLNARVDTNPIIQWQGWQCRRFDQQLYVIPLVEDVPAHSLLWQGQQQIALPSTLGTLVFTSQANDSQDTVPVFHPENGPLHLHFAQFSQRFKPLNAPHSKPLKQWFKAWKIPPWQRDKIVLVSQNAQPLALLIDGKWVLAAQKIMPSNSDMQPARMAIYHRF
jgi:tRNA(Ile)-lysidine synthase